LYSRAPGTVRQSSRLLIIMRIRIIALIVTVAINLPAFGQDSVSAMQAYPKCISLIYGYGSFAVKDYFFSQNTYTGNLPLFSLEWMQPHDRYGYRMGFEFRSSDDIKNHTMTASVTQFSFYQDFLYSIGSFRLFKKNVYAYVGPSLDIYFYYNQQKFSGTGIYFDFSFVTLISAAADVYLNMPIGKRWLVESNLRLSLLSLGLQMPEVMVDEGQEAGATVKLLTPFKGLKTSFDISGRFFIINRLSIGLGYRLEVSNVIIRERVFTLSDNLIGTITFHFKKKDR
jgi:hypothetical protein